MTTTTKIRSVYRVEIDQSGKAHKGEGPVSKLELSTDEITELQILINLFRAEHSQPNQSYFVLQ